MGRRAGRRSARKTVGLGQTTSRHTARYARTLAMTVAQPFFRGVEDGRARTRVLARAYRVVGVRDIKSAVRLPACLGLRYFAK